MRHAVARLLAVLSLSAFVVASCAHFNSPSGTLQCMENSKDEKAAEQLVFAMLDQDSTAALDAAFVLTPDLVKCFLQKAAALKSAGGAAGERAKKAQRFLDAHGLSGLMNLQKMGGDGQYDVAAGVGQLPQQGPARMRAWPGPGADAPGVLLAGFCPWGTCVDDHALSSLRPGRSNEAIVHFDGDVPIRLDWRWALPFEDRAVVVEVRPPGSQLSCSRGLQAYAWAPYAIGAVCMTTDPTFDENRVVAQVDDTLALLSRSPGTRPGPGGG